MDPSNSLVMRIIILYWIEDGNFPMFSLCARILILTIIGEWNHPQFSLVHERKGGHWLEGKISISSHWPRENRVKEGSWGRLTLLLPHMDLNLDLFGSCLCGRRRTYGLERIFLQERSVRLKTRGKC
jgi:hypothetical protein